MFTTHPRSRNHSHPELIDSDSESHEILLPKKIIKPIAPSSPLKVLTKAFVLGKLLLISTLLIVPKQYDTSSQLIIAPPDIQLVYPFPIFSIFAWGISIYRLITFTTVSLIRKLTIWDSVYFTSMAHRGLWYEQEWAFGRFWWLTIRIFTNIFILLRNTIIGVSVNNDYLSFIYYQLRQLSKTLLSSFAEENNVSIAAYALTSIILSNLCHYFATLALYKLTKEIFPTRSNRFAQTTAAVYALSPAGVFLVAGYTESIFALLSFIGLLLRQRKKYFLSGVFFAISCGYRGNGLLWGIMLLYDLYIRIDLFIRDVLSLWKKNPQRQIITIFFDSVRIGRKQIIEAIEIVLGGLLIASVFVFLQVYAYYQYCTSSQPLREWCNYKIPSIFSYVQDKYWGVGFLKYWTPNNIPNFFFAFPTLFIIWKSSIELLKNKNFNNPINRVIVTSDNGIESTTKEITEMHTSLIPFVLVQSVIGLCALLIWHVQIITRVSTCLPGIYWFIAHLISGTSLREIELGRKIVTYSIIWIMAQGILYGAFLPPA